MRRISPLAALIAATLMSGCLLQNMSAQERLRDSVVGFNDEMRWGRQDLAIQRVAPEARAEFSARHHAWGRDIQIADSEIVNVTVGHEGEDAASYVTIQWYRQNSTLLATTTLRQTWERTMGSYAMTGEEVHEGEESLIENPFEEEEEGEEDEDGDDDDDDELEADDDDDDTSTASADARRADATDA